MPGRVAPDRVFGTRLVRGRSLCFQERLEGRQGPARDMVLDPFRVDLGDIFGNADGDEQFGHRAVTGADAVLFSLPAQRAAHARKRAAV